MRKVCPSQYKNWLKTQNEIEPNETTPSPNPFFLHIEKRKNDQKIDSKFVMIQLPTGIFVYEWFTIDSTFQILRDFVTFMDGSLKSFHFVDGFDENIKYSDDDLIISVFQKSKESTMNNSNLHQIQNRRIFLKINS